MTTYVVLLPGDESAWEAATSEQQAAVFARHEAFSRALAERGHTIGGGAELTHSRTTKKVSKDSQGDVVVSDGPYAETVEQLSGFYIVDSDDIDDLLQVCSMLLDDAGTSGGNVIEVRAAVAQDGDGA